MNAESKVIQLKNLVYEGLASLIDHDYMLLGVPHHSNLGDTFIWQGELDFLKGVPYRCLYSAGHDVDINEVRIRMKPDTILLFQGGGNFGDLWAEEQEFRKRIIASCPNQKTIILPQTVYYMDESYLKEDVEFFKKHPEVILCVRDSRSLDLVKGFFPQNPSLLIPDMAFCMDMNRYSRCLSSRGALFITRKDKEYSKGNDYSSVPDNTIVSDWTCLQDSKEYGRINTIEKWVGRVDRWFGMKWQNRAIDWYWQHVLRPFNIREAINLIDRYEQIFTTRMHGAILSLLLGKKDIILFDNSYGKSSSFFDTWLSDVDGLIIKR